MRILVLCRQGTSKICRTPAIFSQAMHRHSSLGPSHRGHYVCTCAQQSVWMSALVAHADVHSATSLLLDTQYLLHESHLPYASIIAGHHTFNLKLHPLSLIYAPEALPAMVAAGKDHPDPHRVKSFSAASCMASFRPAVETGMT